MLNPIIQSILHFSVYITFIYAMRQNDIYIGKRKGKISALPFNPLIWSNFISCLVASSFWS